MFQNFKKIIEYGLYLLVFLLPWQTRLIIKAGELNGGYWEYGTYSLYLTDVVLIVLILFNFVLWLIKSKKLEVRSKNLEINNSNGFLTSYFLLLNSKVWYLIAGLELFVFISIFFAPNKLLAVYGYGRFLLGVGLCWLTASAPYNRLKLIYSLIAGACLSAGLGVWQFLTQASFANKWLGLARHDPADPGASVVEALNGGRWLRAYGGLDHPNILGALLVIGILLTIGLIIKIKKNKNEKFIISNLKFWDRITKLRIAEYESLCLWLVYCLLFTAVFFTFSRGAWLGLAAGLAAMFAVIVRRKHKQYLKQLFKILAITAVLSSILFFLYPDPIIARLSGHARLEIKSNTERVEACEIAKEIIKNDWLFGAGINNYTLAVHNQISPGQPAWYYQPVHNIFLLIWAEIGIFGLIFCIFLLWVTGYGLWEKLENISYSSDYYVSLLPAILIMFLFDHFFWSLHFGVLLFWLIIGLAVRNKAK